MDCLGRKVVCGGSKVLTGPVDRPGSMWLEEEDVKGECVIRCLVDRVW